jgi:hypothetical protein
VGARVRKDRVSVYANVGVHTSVEITLDVESDGDGALIEFGDTGPDLILDVADLDSMERLAAVAAEGARLMRDRGRLVGAGVAVR